MFDANIVSQRPSSEKATALDVDDVDDDDDDDDDDDGSHPAEDRYSSLMFSLWMATVSEEYHWGRFSASQPEACRIIVRCSFFWLHQPSAIGRIIVVGYLALLIL